MKSRVYVETSNAGNYELVTSVAVVDELERGNFPSKSEVIGLAALLPVLQLDSGIGEIVDTYISKKVMPADPRGDALHLALASFHECEFLLTWNCKHLANANKFGHIRLVNVMLGLMVPLLVTPLELLGEIE
jgi:hypothetical protein